MSPQDIKTNFQIPPELKSKFESMVAACMKVLYSETFKNELVEPVESPEEMPGDLVEAALALIKIVDDEFKNKLPRDLFIPVGLYMIAEIADFMKQGGIYETPAEQLGQAMELYIGTLFKASQNTQGAQA